MTEPTQSEFTQMLARARSGDDSAVHALLPLIYGEMRALAGGFFRDQGPAHTLQPTALVHEAFLKLVGPSEVEWQSRAHFFAVAAKAMRHILVNHAAARSAEKRGGGQHHTTLSGVAEVARDIDVLEIDDALRKLEAALAERVKKADAVITTALIPGRPAPRLVDAETVAAMRPGAVVVDLAAEAGGNVAGTVAGEVVNVGGVTLVGTLNLPATMALDASRMYARNIQDVVRHLTPAKPAEGEAAPAPVHIDLDDEITTGALAVYGGEVRHAPTREALGAAS